jgi:hypothetical protein
LFCIREEIGVSYAQDKLKHVPQCAARKLTAVSVQLLNQRSEHTFVFRGLLSQSSRRAKNMER